MTIPGHPGRDCWARSSRGPRRFSALDHYVGRFHPDAVVDVTLQACHGFNIESHREGQNVRERHGLPFLHLETDYWAHDLGQLRTRVEALLEMIPERRLADRRSAWVPSPPCQCR